jgi:hypothetical protein
MKALILLGIIALALTAFSCGKKDNPLPEANNSSYEFKFLSGPLSGREYKASGLTKEQAIALFIEEPEEDLRGISTQLLHGDFSMMGVVALNASDQVLPLVSFNDGVGSKLAFSIKEGSNNYVFGSLSGSLSLKNLKKVAAAGSSLGLATYELSFENATFQDEGAQGNGQTVEVKVSGKIIVK